MENLFVFACVFVFGYIMGQIFFALKIRNAIRKIAEAHGIDLKDVEIDVLNTNTKINVIKIPNLVTESTANSILLYNKDTGDFVTQADNVQELAENVYKFNKINFALVKHDEKQMWFVEGKIKDNLKEI